VTVRATAAEAFGGRGDGVRDVRACDVARLPRAGAVGVVDEGAHGPVVRHRRDVKAREGDIVGGGLIHAAGAEGAQGVGAGPNSRTTIGVGVRSHHDEEGATGRVSAQRPVSDELGGGGADIAGSAVADHGALPRGSARSKMGAEAMADGCMRLLEEGAVQSCDGQLGEKVGATRGEALALTGCEGESVVSAGFIKTTGRGDGALNGCVAADVAQGDRVAAEVEGCGRVVVARQWVSAADARMHLRGVQP